MHFKKRVQKKHSKPKFRFGLAPTPTQQEAYRLHDANFSIGATYPASKTPYIWRRLVHTRIDRSYIPLIFNDRQGILIITGTPSRNLVVLDCETFTEAKRHSKEFQKRNLKPWIVNTARGRHYWWLSEDGELANVKLSAFPGGQAEVRANTNYVLVPPSIHPSSSGGGGVLYEWLYRDGEEPQTISICELDWLPLQLRQSSNYEKRQHFTPGFAGSLDVLSERNRDFIKNGASVGERNHRLFSAAADMAGNAFSFAETYNILEQAASRSGLSREETHKTIRSAYSKPRDPAKPHRAYSKPIPHWRLAQIWANNYHWKKLNATDPNTGRPISTTATVARKVFLALATRAKNDGERGVFRASTREVAELARCTQKTASKALRCLAGNDLIENCGYAPVSGSGLWAFGKAAIFAFSSQGIAEVPHYTPQWSQYTEVVTLKNDAFERGALGATGERIWRAVLEKSMTTKQLAQHFGVHYTTVRRHLLKLLQHGMVKKQKRQWSGVAFGHEALERVAAACGTKGAGERRRAKHERERSLDITMAILRRIYPRYLWENDKDFSSLLLESQFGRQLPLSTDE